MEEPIGSPLRYIIDFAYALGRLSALGDEGALEMLKRVGFAESKKVRRALVDQFRAGMRHERAHGAPTRESDHEFGTGKVSTAP